VLGLAIPSRHKLDEEKFLNICDVTQPLTQLMRSHTTREFADAVTQARHDCKAEVVQASAATG
jgi:hypothetical protein